jgi:pimeloyl-ACP methyl ester carboxylesterase
MTRLVFLPGLASDAAMWQPQLTHLHAAPPAGLTPVVTDVHARQDSIEAMAAALLREQPGDLVLCGASMGGIVAMEVARQAPERIRALALLGTNARPETDDMRALRTGAIEMFRAGQVLDILQANVPLAFHPVNAGRKELVQAYLDMVLRAGAEQLIRQNQAIMARPDARQHLHRIGCPTLVVCGDADQLTPPDCSHEISSLVPGARLVMVPQCGHMLTMEQPDVVNATLAAWLLSL